MSWRAIATAPDLYPAARDRGTSRRIELPGGRDRGTSRRIELPGGPDRGTSRRIGRSGGPGAELLDALTSPVGSRPRSPQRVAFPPGPDHRPSQCIAITCRLQTPATAMHCDHLSAPDPSNRNALRSPVGSRPQRPQCIAITCRLQTPTTAMHCGSARSEPPTIAMHCDHLWAPDPNHLGASSLRPVRAPRTSLAMASLVSSAPATSLFEDALAGAFSRHP
jgi:hypothetical protein